MSSEYEIAKDIANLEIRLAQLSAAVNELVKELHPQEPKIE